MGVVVAGLSPLSGIEARLQRNMVYGHERFVPASFRVETTEYNKNVKSQDISTRLLGSLCGSADVAVRYRLSDPKIVSVSDERKSPDSIYMRRGLSSSHCAFVSSVPCTLLSAL